MQHQELIMEKIASKILILCISALSVLETSLADDNAAFQLKVYEEGPIRTMGRMPEDDLGALAQIKLLFVEETNGGVIIPTLVHAIDITPVAYLKKSMDLVKLDQLRKRNKFEAYGGIGLNGVENREGSGGVVFKIVGANYQGKGWDALIAGHTYRLQTQSGRPEEMWLEIPADVKQGKTYVIRWLVNRRPDKESGISEFKTVKCSVGSQYFKESGDFISLIYWAPQTADMMEKTLETGGACEFYVGRLGGDLNLYVQYAGAASVTSRALGIEKEKLIFPDDASETYDKSAFVTGKLQVSREMKISRRYVLVGLYKESQSLSPLCFKTFDMTGLAEGRNEELAMSFGFVPGKYEARIYQYGGALNVEPGSLADKPFPGFELLDRENIKLSENEKENVFFMK